MLYSYLASSKHIAVEAFSTGGARRLEGWDFRAPGEPASADRDAVFTEETAAFLGVAGEVLSDVKDAQRTQAVVDAVRDSIRSEAVVAVV